MLAYLSVQLRDPLTLLPLIEGPCTPVPHSNMVPRGCFQHPNRREPLLTADDQNPAQNPNVKRISYTLIRVTHPRRKRHVSGRIKHHQQTRTPLALLCRCIEQEALSAHHRTCKALSAHHRSCEIFGQKIPARKYRRALSLARHNKNLLLK